MANTYAVINSSYTGIEGLARYVNDSSGGIVGPFILLGIWLILLISQLTNGFTRSLMTSSLVVSVLAVLLTTVGLLSPTYMYISFAVLGLAAIIVRLNYNW